MSFLELEKFQLEEEQRFALLKREKIEKHYIDAFEARLSRQTSLNFEQFCTIILRHAMRSCINCQLKKANQDPLFDFCPHIVCGDWRILGKLRLLSRGFWKRFINSAPGKKLMICIPKVTRRSHNLFSRDDAWPFDFVPAYFSLRRKEHIELETIPSKCVLGSTCTHDSEKWCCICVCPDTKNNYIEWCKMAGIRDNQIELGSI